MIFPNPMVGVLCDIDDAWELNKELLQAGVPCLYDEEKSFKESYKSTSDIGLLWSNSRFIGLLMSPNADLAMSMPQFRTAFGLNPQTTIMKKKTIEQWIGFLPEPFRAQALANAKPNFLALSKDSLAKALKGAFDWEDSPQGEDYWKRLHKIVVGHEDFHKWPELEQLRLICHSMAESFAKPVAKPEPEPVRLPEWWEQFKAGDLIDVIGIRVNSIRKDGLEARLVVQDGTTTGTSSLWFDGANIRHHKAD